MAHALTPPPRLLIAGLALAGCAKNASGQGTGPIVDVHAWQAVAREDDPFNDRPDDDSCPEQGLEVITLPEEVAAVGGVPGAEVLQVHTGDCRYLTTVQPAARALQKGETLHLRLWHFALLAPAPAQAHAALRVGDKVVWEDFIEIPRPSALVEAEWQSEGLPAGTPIYFHLHNHGANTWALWELAADE